MMKYKMNKKGFLDFDEINPMAIGLAVVGGFISLFVAAKMNPEMGIITKVLTFGFTSFVCFLMANAMSDG